jgi:hypothetical protein
VGAVRQTSRPPVGNEQEDFVALSAHECASSAASDADLVIPAEADLATATSRFAASATSMVRSLADPR